MLSEGQDVIRRESVESQSLRTQQVITFPLTNVDPRNEDIVFVRPIDIKTTNFGRNIVLGD